MLNLDIDLTGGLEKWVGSQIDSGRFASPADYLRHLIEQDQHKQTEPDARFTALFDYVGVKNREEYHKLAAAQSLTVKGEPHEIEVMNFLDSIDDGTDEE